MVYFWIELLVYFSTEISNYTFAIIIPFLLLQTRHVASQVRTAFYPPVRLFSRGEVNDKNNVYSSSLIMKEKFPKHLCGCVS